MPPIIVTLTTIPERFNGVHSETEHGMISNIDSLLNQVFEGEYEIHLNIPDVLKYTGEAYIIPQWLLDRERDNPKLKLFRGVADMGPITKLYHTVMRTSDPEAIIIVCDDDLVYDPRMVAEQVKNQETYVNTVCGYDGSRADDTHWMAKDCSDDPFYFDVRNHFVVSVYKDVDVNFLQHYKTVSYRRSFFGEDFQDFIREFCDPETFSGWNDDITVGAYMHKNGIKEIVRCFDGEEKLITLEQWQEKGGVLSFPVIRHIARGGEDGCYRYRRDNLEYQYSEYVKRGYLR